MGKRKTTEQFIADAVSVHGDKYDYSKVQYKGSKSKVEIVCKAHGSFWQEPTSHLSGIGCPKCGRINASNKNKLTNEEFIAKARKIHGDYYDYSKVNYINSKIKVCIICPIHGEFWQQANSHLNGEGCVKCSYIYRGKIQSISTDEFIKRAKEIHGDKYDYSKVNYISNNTKVCIVCPKHGEFWQTPSGHINSKQGCPKCYDDRRRSLVLGWGINDSENPIIHGSVNGLVYKTWTSMIRRCYSDKYNRFKPTYIECEVCEEWKYFSNFEKWFKDNYKDGFVLDKDILVQGNKVYSPETCCFVPPYINSLLVTNDKNRGKLKLGVYLHQGKYVAQCGINKVQQRIGAFNSEEEAHEAYKKAKYSEIKRVAKESLEKEDIDSKVYNALLNYKISEY